MLQAAKIIGRALRTTRLIRAGVGIGVVLVALILGVARNPSLRGQLFSYAVNKVYIWIIKIILLMCISTVSNLIYLRHNFKIIKSILIHKYQYDNYI